VQDDFRVTRGREAVTARLEIPAQLDVVEDLAVEHDPSVPSSFESGCWPVVRSMMDSRA
jgi:hypothetical protein